LAKARGKTSKVRLNADLRKTERLLRDLKELCGAESPPKLISMTIARFARFGIMPSTSSQRGQYQSVEKPGA